MENKPEIRKQLPTIQELYSDVPEQSKQNALNVLLNNNPNPKWTKVHPFIHRKVNGEKVPYYYIPIERIEWLLTTVFLEWNVEIKTVQLIANSVSVTVRLNYRNPITGEWAYQDGLGASPLQTDEGAGAIEFNKMKTGAVMMAAPAAEVYAIKDAAEKIGKLFGKDLNRADQVAYENLKDKFEYENKATAEQINFIIPMLSKIGTDLREKIEAELNTYTKDEAQLCINMLIDAMPDPIQTDNYSQSDIHSKLNDVMSDERK